MASIKEANVMISQEMAKQKPCPVGTLAFRLSSEKLANPESSGGVILEVANGSHVFHIEREMSPRVSFYHWSPGTGSRCASVDVAGMRGPTDVQLVATWSPQEIGLCIIPVQEPRGGERWAKGVPSQRQFRVTRNRKIVQVGDHGVDVMQPRMFEGDSLVLEPTALELWQGVETAAQILLSGKSEDGYMFEVVQANYVLTALVTGFESHCQKRCIELEEEGVAPNVNNLLKITGLKTESAKEALERATNNRVTLLRQLVELDERINFQDFERSKKLYNKVYGLKLGEIGMRGDQIDRLRSFFKYRHRVVHISPILAPLNEPLTAGKQPEFPNKALAHEAVAEFAKFIRLFHGATLSLGVLSEKVVHSG
jgi:hypothetical protein